MESDETEGTRGMDVCGNGDEGRARVEVDDGVAAA